MDGNGVREVVRRAVATFAPEPPSKIDTTSRLIDDLGFHSLALLELAVALELRFTLPPIDLDTAMQIHTVSDVEEYVLQELRARQRQSD